MKNYTENCKKNLLEYSHEKMNYITALKEWYFNYEVIDNNEYFDVNVSKKSCELCEREDIRWQFTIINIYNNNQLKVGSSCIKQFDVVLVDKNGNKIYGKERNKMINKLIDLHRISSSNKLTFLTLNELCKANKSLEFNNYFIDCWTELKVNGTIEPKKVLFLINNFIDYGIGYKDLDLRIDLKKRKYVEQIKSMSKITYTKIRPFINDRKWEYYDKYFEDK